MKVTLVGHPFAPIGMGEHVRCTHRAFRTVGVTAELLDLYGLCTPDEDDYREFSGWLTKSLGGIQIFHLNGDEIPQAESTLRAQFGSDTDTAYRIVYPAWELSKYPETWARDLERFDEIWAPSKFVADSIASVVKRPVLHLPLACEVVLSSYLMRRWFGLPESSYIFLFFFDLRSYSARKNPRAVIAAFKDLLRRRPSSDVVLVIKVHGLEKSTDVVPMLKAEIAELGRKAYLIDRELCDNEVKNLIRVSDCFVSLHRSEGFGRGMCEAMALGKPVIGTGYSGNLDFMNSLNSLLVDFSLVPVRKGEYPFPDGQYWADPDVDCAARLMTALVDDPTHGRAIGQRAAQDIRGFFSYQAAGLRYFNRINSIRNNF